MGVLIISENDNLLELEFRNKEIENILKINNNLEMNLFLNTNFLHPYDFKLQSNVELSK